MFEKRDVVGGRLDAQHDPVLVVHFDGGLSHVVFDAGSLNAGVKVIAHVILVVAVEEFVDDGAVGLYGLVQRFVQAVGWARAGNTGPNPAE